MWKDMKQQWRDEFDRDGFVVIRGFFRPDEVDEFRNAWEQFLRAVAPGAAPGDVMYDEPRETGGRPKQANCLQRVAAFDAPRHGGRVRELVEALIGPVTPQQCEFFDKPPGEGNTPTPPHQDGYYFCLKPNVACTVWIPLDAADEENGALRYVRGSHRLGVLPHRATSVLGFSQGLAPDPAGLGEAVLCAVEPGDVLAHHSLTVHFAGRNRSAARHRRSIGYVFFSAAAEIDEEARARYQAALRAQHAAKGVGAGDGA